MPGCHKYQLYSQSVRRRCSGRAPSVSLLSDSIDMRRELASSGNYIQHTNTQLIAKYWNYTSSFSLTRFSSSSSSSSWDERRASKRVSGSEIWVFRILKRSVHTPRPGIGHRPPPPPGGAHPAPDSAHTPRRRWTASPLINRLIIYFTVVRGKRRPGKHVAALRLQHVL